MATSSFIASPGAVLIPSSHSQFGRAMDILVKSIVSNRMTSTCLVLKCRMASSSTQVAPQESTVRLKKWQITGFSNDLSTLKLSEDLPLPYVNGPNEVLIDVKAASVNPIDVAMARGYGHNLLRIARVTQDMCGPEKLTYDKFPMTLGRDFSGVIIRKGAGVTKFKVGDEVWGVIPPQSTEGSHANYVVAKDSHISLKPQKMSHVDAASIPYAGLTAHSALTCFGGMNESNSFNKKVVVLGGTGGVGLMAIQILKAWGAYVTTTCSGDAREWIMSQTSVDHVIDYRTKELQESHQNSYDLVLNAASANRAVFDDALKCLKKWKNSKYLTVTSPLLKNYDLNGYLWGTVKTATDVSCDTIKGLKEGTQIRWAYFLPNGQGLHQMKIMVDEGRLHPVVEKVVDFQDAPDAYRKVDMGHARGKTVIQLESF